MGLEEGVMVATAVAKKVALAGVGAVWGLAESLAEKVAMEVAAMEAGEGRAEQGGWAAMEAADLPGMEGNGRNRSIGTSP
eukprot:2814361-Pleurochrysis_carterae.AAC.2